MLVFKLTPQTARLLQLELKAEIGLKIFITGQDVSEKKPALVVQCLGW